MCFTSEFTVLTCKTEFYPHVLGTVMTEFKHVILMTEFVLSCTYDLVCA